MRFSGPFILVGAFIIVMFSILVAGVAANAQTQQQMDGCVNKGNAFTPDLIIDGCMAVIQSGRWSGNELAPAFLNRGVAYRRIKGKDAHSTIYLARRKNDTSLHAKELLKALRVRAISSASAD